jgi:hypothetical protein
VDTGRREAGRSDLLLLFQNQLRRSSIDTIGIEATSETIPPLLIAAERGQGTPFQIVSMMIFEVER